MSSDTWVCISYNLQKIDRNRLNILNISSLLICYSYFDRYRQIEYEAVGAAVRVHILQLQSNLHFKLSHSASQQLI